MPRPPSIPLDPAPAAAPRPSLSALRLLWPFLRPYRGTLFTSIGLAFVSSYSHFGPRAHFTPAELRIQEANAHAHPGTSNDPTSANESSTTEHLASLRAGARTALHHPWGFGLDRNGHTRIVGDFRGQIDFGSGAVTVGPKASTPFFVEYAP